MPSAAVPARTPISGGPAAKTLPSTSFEHLLVLSDEIGTLARADHAQPRRRGGYRTAVVARVAMACARQPEPTRAVVDLGRTSHRFLEAAVDGDGRVRSRRDPMGDFEDGETAGEDWGLAVRAWGTVLRLGVDARIRREATTAFRRHAAHREPSVRALAHAGLGAAEVLTARPHYDDAAGLLTDAALAIGAAGADRGWPWPEERLTGDDAVCCEVLIAAGHLLDRPDLLDDGLALLGWLLDRQIAGGRLSCTPEGGAGREDVAPAFPQRPGEVGALADALGRAAAVTGDDRWVDALDLVTGWFGGRNDAGALMWDPETDGAYDVLTADGADPHQGPEATVALLTTLQQARAARAVG